MYGGRETERENATGPVKRNAHSPQMYRIMVKQGHHKHSFTFFIWLTEPTAGSETRRQLSFCSPLFQQSRRVWVADLLWQEWCPTLKTGPMNQSSLSVHNLQLNTHVICFIPKQTKERKNSRGTCSVDMENGSFYLGLMGGSSITGVSDLT